MLSKCQASLCSWKWNRVTRLQWHFKEQIHQTLSMRSAHKRRHLRPCLSSAVDTRRHSWLFVLYVSSCSIDCSRRLSSLVDVFCLRRSSFVVVHQCWSRSVASTTSYRHWSNVDLRRDASLPVHVFRPLVSSFVDVCCRPLSSAGLGYSFVLCDLLVLRDVLKSVTLQSSPTPGPPPGPSEAAPEPPEPPVPAPAGADQP